VGVINRRNAVAGWAVWKLAKRVLKRKLRQKTETVPAPVVRAARRPKTLLAVVAALGGGITTFLRWRKGRGPE
jgi:hypothetical protein